MHPDLRKRVEAALWDDDTPDHLSDLLLEVLEGVEIPKKSRTSAEKTLKEAEMAYQMRLEGVGLREMAKKLGKSSPSQAHQLIQKHCKANGLPFPAVYKTIPPKRRSKRDILILKLHSHGRTQAEIGRWVGLTRARVGQILLELGAR